MLPLIADPGTYRADTIDLRERAARDYWLELFEKNTPGAARRAAQSEGNTADALGRAEAMTEEFYAFLAATRRDPRAWDGHSILHIARTRQRLLAKYEFADPFWETKRRENETCLAMLPGLLAELDGRSDDRRLLAQVECVLAGNIFDLGCEGPAALYEAGQLSFLTTRSDLPVRPWLIDDFDVFAGRFRSQPYRKAVLVVDNAGADFVLGMIPLAYYLLQCGTRVVMAANSGPALNDITVDEARSLISSVRTANPAIEQACEEGWFTLVASGNDTPMIDFTVISDAFAEAAQDADLLVIEGMGRALETNYHTRFTCDTLKVAMIKDPYMASLFSGKLYDVVCRFEPAMSDATLGGRPKWFGPRALCIPAGDREEK